MKVKELKPILEYLDEANFTIVSNNESKETDEWIPFGGDGESFWS